MHLLINRKHRRNDNQEGGGTAAIQMADDRQYAGHNCNSNDIIAYALHQPVDDNIKHTGIGHDTEIGNGKYKQSRCRAGT